MNQNRLRRILAHEGLGKTALLTKGLDRVFRKYDLPADQWEYAEKAMSTAFYEQEARSEKWFKVVTIEDSGLEGGPVDQMPPEFWLESLQAFQRAWKAYRAAPSQGPRW